MAKTDPILNISLNDDNLLEMPPSIILYGVTDSGKSTAAAQAFPDLLWLTTSPTVLRPYASWLRDNPKEAEERKQILPAQKFLPEFEKDGVTKTDTRGMMRDIIQRYCASVQAGTVPYKGIVIDEYTEITRRVYDSIKKDAGFGKNQFAKIEAYKAWNAWICALSKIIGQTVILICHEAEPKYDQDEESPTHNSLQYRGGPQLHVGSERHAMASQADICLRLRVAGSGDGVRRIFVTKTDSLWIAKFRDFSIKYEEANNLRDLCKRAGYKV